MSDYVIRATAADGLIRAFAATTRDMTEQARIAHNTSPVATAALGRLLTAGAMMGVDMKGEDDILTLKIQGDGPHRRPHCDGGFPRAGEGLRVQPPR